VETVLERRAFDRRLYRMAAILFALIVLFGFSRTYYLKAFFGTPALPSALVHLHGALMSAWVVLFVTQAWLIASKQVRRHQRLGYAAIGLALLIVVTGIPTALRAAKYGSLSTPPDLPPLGFLIMPLGDLVLFAIFFAGAIYCRRQPAAHKSWMLLTAINFLPPALARIPIPALVGLGPISFMGVPTTVAVACIVFDWRQRGQMNRVLVGGTALLVASYALRLALITNDAWIALASRLTSVV
jgi:hypothetical protein